jgi:hypothetical protein
MLENWFSKSLWFSKGKNKLKEDNIGAGLMTWDFDVFGFSETNTDWWLLPEELKLQYRTKHWWDSLHLSYASNTTSSPCTAKQFGTAAVFSIIKASYRVIEKGSDPLSLGR